VSFRVAQLRNSTAKKEIASANLGSISRARSPASGERVRLRHSSG